MARFDRYMLSQLVVLFGFFSLILVLIYWINRAVSLFDRLIADGQSAWVFLELTSLSLPSIIRVVLPLSAFVATVYVTNRMASESELTVVQATGYSPFRLARPVLYFGLFVALLLSVLTHILVPLSTDRLTQRNAEIADDVTARLLTPGEFLTPSDDVTFYIREITPAGEMLDIFISEGGDPATRVTYTAARAFLVRTDDGPQLVLVNGLAQTLDLETNRLLTTGFEDFVYNIGALIDAGDITARRADALMTWELFAPSGDVLAETGESAAGLALRGHDRIGQALLGLVAAMIGFSALVTGRFSRFGLWRQILLAVGLIVLVQAIDTTGASAAQADPARWPLLYLGSACGLLIAVVLLWLAARPYAFKRKPLPAAGGVT
ncbi:MAG: LPS export ABC transporter permease LptF [Pseudomonadota bacterium]